MIDLSGSKLENFCKIRNFEPIFHHSNYLKLAIKKGRAFLVGLQGVKTNGPLLSNDVLMATPVSQKGFADSKNNKMSTCK